MPRVPHPRFVGWVLVLIFFLIEAVHNRALLHLLFSFVLIVTVRPHRVSRYVIRDSGDPEIPPGATASEVNAAKDTRIGDFGDRLGKPRIGTRAWTYLGGEAECGVLSKCGSQDERGGATIRGMGRRILGMRRSTGQRVQQWPPIGIGVSRRGTRSDRGDWPPENVAVFAIPARRYRVRRELH